MGGCRGQIGITHVFSVLVCFLSSTIISFLSYYHYYRILANHTTERESKQSFLLNGLSQLQLAVTVQEHAVQNAESLLHPQEEVNLSSVIVMMFSAKKRCELFNLSQVLRNFVFSSLYFQQVTESLLMFEAAENKAEKGL